MKNPALVESLQYEQLEELKLYFDTELFNEINISNSNNTLIMMEVGYLSNVTTRFWRLLQTNKLLTSKKADVNYSNFLLETFLNQASSCTDNLATCLNYFMNLSLSGPKLALHNETFQRKFNAKIVGFPDIAKIHYYQNWVSQKLYPYRNIVHHMGEASGLVEASTDFKSIVCCYVLKEDEWDFVSMRQNLKNYPSHTAWQIATNNINLPNILTGSQGDQHKYIRIDTFFDDWIEKTYELIKKYIEALIWYQSKNYGC